MGKIPFMIFLLEGGCLQGIYGTKGSYWLSGSHHVESFTVATMTWLIEQDLDIDRKTVEQDIMNVFPLCWHYNK
jgi:hypothetical protein